MHSSDVVKKLAEGKWVSRKDVNKRDIKTIILNLNRIAENCIVSVKQLKNLEKENV